MPGDSGKTDMERIGLFQEMSYTSVQDPYVDGIPKPFNEEAYKGKQFLVEGSKKKAATQAGYFDREFARIFEKEAYSDRFKLRRQAKLKAAQKNLDGVFFPSQTPKKWSGLGSYYGTIGGSFKAFSGIAKPKQPFVAENKNFYTNPGKKGTGYGYNNVTIGPPYEHAADAYIVKDTKKEQLLGGPFRLNLYPREYFDSNPYRTEKILPPLKEVPPMKKIETPFKPASPGKSLGGMKAGAFDVYPAHFSTLMKDAKESQKVGRGLVFRPNAGPKSRPVKSVLTTNINRVVNNLNYKTVDRVMVY